MTYHFEYILKPLFRSGLEPDTFRCIIKECGETEDSHGNVTMFSEAIFGRTDEGKIDYCRRYPISNLSVPGVCNGVEDFDITASDDRLVQCTPSENIIYGEYGMDYTVVTRFNLVCDDQYKVLKKVQVLS